MVKLNLRKIRRPKDLTQEKLTLAAGITRGMVANYETAVQMPSAEALWKLADALGVKMDDLIEVEEEEVVAYPLHRLTQKKGERMIPEASLIEGVKVTFTTGQGTESDPSRRATGYWTRDGELIAIIDPIRETLPPPVFPTPDQPK
jgi:transcriptional regulator with XRE-family HTH domain